MFILVISNTEVANIKGLTIAGESPELVKFTPVADAEFLFYNKPITIDAIPVTPEGHPTPAIITKASKILSKFPVLVVRSGTEIPPYVPHSNIYDKPGLNIVERTALPELEKILEKSEVLGKELSFVNEVYIGESIPGGTTTAMAILNSLGYDSIVSSAGPNNPVELKRKVVSMAFQREKPRDDWYHNLKEYGDPMMAFVVGFSQGFNGKIYLAGGTQMLAVAALLKESGIKPEKILTTKYIVNDKSSTFVKTAREIGIEYYSANLDFSNSRFRGLRDYENGYVKEGVGAGGSVYLAQKAGFSPQDVSKKVEEIYENITGKK